MRLLVSVRGAEEVEAALAGGADIIDAKEPSRGSLGRVDADVLARIAGRVPATVPLSVALGDATDARQVGRAVATLQLPLRQADTYVKVGFRDRDAHDLLSVMRAGVRAAADTGLIFVPVAYADYASAASPRPEEVFESASAAEVQAMLVDTYLKDGRSLLDWIDMTALTTLRDRVRGAGMLLALAGSLSQDDLATAAAMADVVGVRGAACRGGRDGVVDASLVRQLRDRISLRAVPASFSG